MSDFTTAGEIEFVTAHEVININGETQGAGEAPAIGTKIHLLYTYGKQKNIIL